MSAYNLIWLHVNHICMYVFNTDVYVQILIYFQSDGSVRSVIVIVVRNGHGDTRSNPGLG